MLLTHWQFLPNNANPQMLPRVLAFHSPRRTTINFSHSFQPLFTTLPTPKRLQHPKLCLARELKRVEQQEGCVWVTARLWGNDKKSDKQDARRTHTTATQTKLCGNTVVSRSLLTSAARGKRQSSRTAESWSLDHPQRLRVTHVEENLKKIWDVFFQTWKKKSRARETKSACTPIKASVWQNTVD